MAGAGAARGRKAAVALARTVKGGESACWGRHLRPSTESLRTGGARVESVINHVFAGQAKFRSPQAKTSCETLRRGTSRTVATAAKI